MPGERVAIVGLGLIGASLGLALRRELYTGQRDVLNVMKHYCAEHEILANDRQAQSKVGQKLRQILDVV